MEFFIVELCNICNRRLDTREELLLPYIVESIGLDDGNVDAAQEF